MPDKAQPSAQALLARALRANGFGFVCRDEPRDWTDSSTRLSYIFMSGFVGADVAVLSDWTNASTAGWLGILTAVLLVLAAIAALTSPGAAAIVAVALYCVFAVFQIGAGDGDDAWVTLALPFAVTALGVWVTHRRRLATAARVSPLLLPVTLTVLLIPLFTDNLWEAAVTLSAYHFVLLAGITALPLVLVLRGRLQAQLPSVLSAVTDRLMADRAATRDRATARLLAGVDQGEQAQLDRAVEAELRRAFNDLSPDHRDLVVRRMTAGLGRRQPLRLLWTAIGVGVGIFIYIYVLAWVLIPAAVAAGWTGEPVAMERLDLLVATLSLPTGPYVAVAALLATIASAILLAFVLTEQHYEEALTDALLRAPLEESLALALPYTALATQAGATTPA